MVILSVFYLLPVPPIGGFDHFPNITNSWIQGYKAYRQSPQFKAYIKNNAGIYNYWQEQGFSPTCRALAKDDFECG
ncbi:MAG: hypothetical protein ACJAVV_003532 [Alphaproteobacteria bacterium]|jgi:hypothetical protein